MTKGVDVMAGNSPAGKGLTSMARKEALFGYIAISPWLIGFVALTLGPILASLVLTVYKYDIISPPQYVGLANFQTAWADPLFWHSLKITAIYTVLAVPLNIVGSVTVALLMNFKLRGIRLFRTVYYLPTVISGVAVALLWYWIFSGDYGILNMLLRGVGIQGPDWLNDENWVLYAFVLMTLWGVGGNMPIYLAGLQGVPTQLYEAAELDGANSWQRFWRVTLPMISPVIFFNLIMGMIGTFQVFTQAYVMTNGGPRNATLFYALYLYQNAFQYMRMGYASVLAWVFFIIIFILTLVMLRSSEAWVYYEATVKGRKA